MKTGFNNAVGPQVREPTARGSKLLPALAALSLGGGLQAATQFFAKDMRYQAALGAHVGDHIYAPWGIVQWAAKWYSYYPDAFMRAGGAGITVAGVGLNRGAHLQNGCGQHRQAERLPARFGALGREERYAGGRPAAATAQVA